MTRAGDWTGVEQGGLGQGLGDRYPLQGRHVCPFCGSINETMEGPCPHCTMSNTADTRKATKSRIGPWYVLQSRNPAAPGMRYETLLSFIRKGRVKARSIVRGPTTHQLWRFACQVKGVSREFGLCYSCGGSIERDAQLCPQCNRLQDPPNDPDMFIEGQAAAAPDSSARPPASDTAVPAEVPSAAAAIAAVAEATEDVRRSPIFKDLNRPPAAEPASKPAPAPVMMDDGAAFFRGTPAVLAEPPVAPPPAAPAPSAAAHAAAPHAAPGVAVKKNAGDVFLSAKDLAAAFQLGFDGEADDEIPAGLDAEAPWTGPNASVGHLHPAPRPRKRKRRKGRMLLVLIVLAVGGFGAYLAVDAASRRRVFQWAESRYMALIGADLYPDLARARPGAPAVPAVTPPAETGDDQPVGDRGPTAASIAPARIPASPVDVPASPVETIVPPAQTQPAPAAAAGPATQPVARPQPPQTQPAAEPKPALTHEDAVKKSRELYIQALEAEERGDYRKAKALYEQIIKTLPQDTWYQGIEARLRIAEDMLGEK
jgi:hypothetical protein